MAMQAEKKIEQLFHSTRYRGALVSCVYCGHSKLYRIENGKRYKCSRCQKKFRDWTFTGLDGCRLQPSMVYVVLSDFCRGVSALQVSKNHDLSYQTVFDLYNRIRSFLPQITLQKDLEASFLQFSSSYLSLYRGIQKNHAGYDKELKWRFVTQGWTLKKKIQHILDILLGLTVQ